MYILLHTKYAVVNKRVKTPCHHGVYYMPVRGDNFKGEKCHRGKYGGEGM